MKALCFENHITQREAVLRQVVRRTPGEHRTQAGHCGDADEAGLAQERELRPERHSEFNSLLAGSILSPATLVTSKEGRDFDQGL